MGLTDKSDFEKLSKKEQKNLPHTKDKFLKGPNDNNFGGRYRQSKFQVKKQGALANCDYEIAPNGGTKTPRTEANIEKFQTTIVEICTDPESSWYDDNSKYIVPLTNDEERGTNSINVLIYIILIFGKTLLHKFNIFQLNKETDNFMTL